MQFIDGYLIPVPLANRQAFEEQSAKMNALFKEYGAVSYNEYWGEELPEGKLTSMHLAVDRQQGETVVFGWIAWPSKQARDAAWQKIHADRQMSEAPNLFDGKRMIMGGFVPLNP